MGTYCLDRSSVTESDRCFVVDVPIFVDAKNLYSSIDLQPQTPSYVPLLGRTGELLILEVKIDEQNNIIVSDNEFFVYGVGKTKEEALNDYRISLVEYSELISEYTDRRSVQLANMLKQFLPENN